MITRLSAILTTLTTGAILAMTSVPSVEAERTGKAHVYKIAPHRKNLDDKLLLLTLQGIVNRAGPRLLIDGEGLADWAPADKHWQEVYKERKGLSFENIETMDDLVKTFDADINGVVIYDPKLDATRYIAVTMAGLNFWLPVSPDQLKGELAGLPVKEDLRGRWEDQTSAYEWAMKELLPKCSRDVAFNAGQSHDDVKMGTDLAVILALDFAVSKKAFVFNLSPSKEPGTYGWDKIPVPAYPEDARLMGEIFDRLQRPAKVYGWAEPEWTFTSKLSRHGHFLMCGTSGNLSFHAAVPARNVSYRQPRTLAGIEPKSEPEKKHYVAFMTNEGDTPRVLTSFFFGAWLNPDRGKLPINWGINPYLLHEFPVFAEYYFSTATENDYFYAGCSGAAYVFIDQLPSIEHFAKFGRPYFDQFDIHMIDAWDEFEYHQESYETYAKEAGAKLFTLLPRGDTRVEFLSSGVPVITPDERMHYKTGNPKKDVPNLVEIAGEKPAPFLIPCYGGVNEHGPTYYLRTMEQLPKEQFEVVTLADMAVMAPKIAAQSGSDGEKSAENR